MERIINIDKNYVDIIDKIFSSDEVVIDDKSKELYSQYTSTLDEILSSTSFLKVFLNKNNSKIDNKTAYLFLESALRYIENNN